MPNVRCIAVFVYTSSSCNCVTDIVYNFHMYIGHIPLSGITVQTPPTRHTIQNQIKPKPEKPAKDPPSNPPNSPTPH